MLSSTQASLPQKPVTQTNYPANSGTVLTVGQGMEFSTLSAAVNASQNGDTILVQAGTYYNDFVTVNTSLSILAMGGVVNEVATVPPPNDKGLILVNNNLTIQGFTFTGGSDGSPDGNVSGIRYQAGNLSVQYCDFTNMQEGLLATPGVTGTGTITINQSEFSDCGTGDGYSHDIYIGAVAAFTLTNSYVHNAIVGHEVKSRAATTTIKNNVIADGTGGTSSYEIDIPNAGVAVVSGNTIEKGPDASNPYAIHYGGETQYGWSKNSISITSNTIINEFDGGIAVDNQSSVNGLSVSVSLTSNKLYGFAPGNLITGPGVAKNNTTLNNNPGYSTLSPWVNPPAESLGSGTEVLNLVNFGNSVNGGAQLFQVTDSGGNNTIVGGTGGLRLTATGGWDAVSTSASATDTITFSLRNNTLTSAGKDTILDNGQYDEINATGQATITAGSFSTDNLAGVETINVNGDGVLNVLSTGQVTSIIGTAGMTGSKAAGGWLKVQGTGPGAMLDTISGASASLFSNSGTYFAAAFGNTGGVAVLDGGANSITGGNGSDAFTIEAGTDTIALGGGADTVFFQGGTASVSGGAGVDIYQISSGQSGQLDITGFKQGTDNLVYAGFSGNAVSSGTVVNGSTTLFLSDGASILLAGVALPGYPGGSAGGGSGGGGGGSGGGSGGGGPTVGGGSGGITLTTSGQSVVGGASLLTVTDLAGGNTIAGGSGGVDGIQLGSDAISTAALSSNSLTLSGNDTLLGAGADTVLVTGLYNSLSESASATVLLNVFGNSITGGAGLLTVTDSFGGNDVSGGAGGVVFNSTSSYETITTAAGAEDTVSAGGNSVLTLAGNDQASLTGNYSQVLATGTDYIAASGFSNFVLDGTDTLAGTAAGVVTVGTTASVSLVSTGVGGEAITKLAGGVVTLQQTMPDGSAATVTVSGGLATLGSSSGQYSGISVTTSGQGDSVVAGTGPSTITSAGPDTVWAGAGNITMTASGAASIIGGSGALSLTSGAAGVSVLGGSGNVTLQGGSGNDSFTGGSGSALLYLGSGADSIVFGSGLTDVFGGANDVFVAICGSGGNDTINGFVNGDVLNFQGFSGNAVAAETLAGGNTYLALADGTNLEITGVQISFLNNG